MDPIRTCIDTLQHQIQVKPWSLGALSPYCYFSLTVPLPLSRKGWLLHKAHGEADAQMESIDTLQHQMMEKIASGQITPDELAEFKKLMAELSNDLLTPQASQAGL